MQIKFIALINLRNKVLCCTMEHYNIFSKIKNSIYRLDFRQCVLQQLIRIEIKNTVIHRILSRYDWEKNKKNYKKIETVQYAVIN